MLFYTLIFVCGQESHAEDITQEVYIHVFNRIDSFKGESSLGAWIKQIAVHVSLNHVKRHQNLLSLTEVPVLEEKVSVPPFPLAEWSVQFIHNAIEKLPLGSRTVPILFLFESYQHQILPKS